MKVLTTYIVTGILLAGTAFGDAVGEPVRAADERLHVLGDVCPDEEAIAPCICSYIVDGDGEMDLDCSEITGEEQLGQVFEKIPSAFHFETFTLNSNHKLKVLKSGVFGTITFSKILMIYNSVFEEVESGALDGCAETLTTIDMWGNGITSLTGFPFMDLQKFPSLKVLDLADNTIPEWPVDIKSDTLIRLDLSGNPLSLLPEGAFDGLSVLQDLVLGNANLTVIDPGTFASLGHLESLDLRQNKFTDLSEGALTFTSPNISHIYVHHNKLKSIHPHAISSQNNVPDLHFNTNELIALEEAVWRSWLEAGSRLTFDGNPIICDCGVAWLVQNRDLIEQVEEPVLCAVPNNWKHHLHCLMPVNYENC